MANVQLQVHWTFVADPDEAALILAALGGRLRPEDVERAKALGDKLTLTRARTARDFADQMATHAGKVPSNKPGER